VPIDREKPEQDPEGEEEYPAGSEVPSEPAGVGDNVEEDDQPGLSDDPPQAD
jgi:hypothetical protein